MKTFAKMSKSKRFRLTILVLAMNFAIFTYGIYSDSDLSSLGTGLSLLNAPLYAYILGESYRPSGDKPSKDSDPIVWLFQNNCLNYYTIMNWIIVYVWKQGKK